MQCYAKHLAFAQAEFEYTNYYYTRFDPQDKITSCTRDRSEDNRSKVRSMKRLPIRRNVIDHAAVSKSI